MRRIPGNLLIALFLAVILLTGLAARLVKTDFLGLAPNGRVALELDLKLVVPGPLESVVPARNKLFAVAQLGREPGSFTHPVVIERKGPMDLHVKVLNIPGGADDFLRIALYLCPADVPSCLMGSAILSGSRIIHVSAGQRHVDAGRLYLARHYRIGISCAGRKPELTGIVIPTATFPSSPAPGKKFGLAIFGGIERGFADAPHVFDEGPNPLFPNDPEKRLLYWNLPGPDHFLVYAGPFQPSKRGYRLSVPFPENYEGKLLAVVVECDRESDWKSCAHSAFPVPVNVDSIPGRFYRLIGEDFMLPACGMENVRLYAHEFGATPPPNEPLPREIIEGALY